MTTEITIVAFCILLALSAFFSGAEIAFFSLSSARVRTMSRRKLYGASLVESLRKQPQQLLATILIGNNVVNVATASLATELALRTVGSYAISVATGIVTLALLLFGEIFPKAIAQAQAGVIARLTARPLWICMIVFYPLVWLFGNLGQWLARLTGAKANRITEEELRSVLHLGVEHGAVEQREQRIVERLLRFNDVPVKEVMTPLSRTTMLNGDAVISQVLHRVAHDQFSRFPVYVGGQKQVVGYVHLKHMMRANASEARDALVASIMQPVTSVPPGAHLDDVLRVMMRRSEHLLLVADRKNKPLGIITLEDLLEELVGEISDEADKRAAQNILPSKDGA